MSLKNFYFKKYLLFENKIIIKFILNLQIIKLKFY